MRVKNSIPNFLTSLNLLCGSVAVVFALQNDFYMVGIFLSIAAVMDFADGFAARLLKAYSPMGKELDSLADMISFGLLPSVLIFTQFENLDSISDSVISQILPFTAFLIAVFSALRLPKFNLDDNQQEHFKGLPTPANTLLIASFIIGFHLTDQKWIFFRVLEIMLSTQTGLVILILLSSFLLVSPFTMISLKFKTFKFKKNAVRYSFLLTSVVLIVIWGLKAISLVMMVYLTFSFLQHFAVKNNKQ